VDHLLNARVSQLSSSVIVTFAISLTTESIQFGDLLVHVLYISKLTSDMLATLPDFLS